jgi:hypothetical protein
LINNFVVEGGSWALVMGRYLDEWWRCPQERSFKLH